MSDFLTNIAARHVGPADVIKPRVPSLFEPARPSDGLLSKSAIGGHEILDGEIGEDRSEQPAMAGLAMLSVAPSMSEPGQGRSPGGGVPQKPADVARPSPTEPNALPARPLDGVVSNSGPARLESLLTPRQGHSLIAEPQESPDQPLASLQASATPANPQKAQRAQGSPVAAAQETPLESDIVRHRAKGPHQDELVARPHRWPTSNRQLSEPRAYRSPDEAAQAVSPVELDTVRPASFDVERKPTILTGSVNPSLDTTKPVPEITRQYAEGANGWPDGINNVIMPAPRLQPPVFTEMPRRSVIGRQLTETAGDITRPRSFNVSQAPKAHSETTPEPAINITIGRVEIKAITEQVPKPKTKSAPPIMSLDEYLSGRTKRGNR